MIICTNCGNHNEDSDEFCGSCGKFLEWVGERVEAPVAAVEETAEPAVEAKVGLIDRVKAAVGVEGGTGLSTEPTGPTPEELELEAAATAAAARADAEGARLQAEAAVAAERAARAADEARQRADDEARARAEAETAREAEEQARALAREEAETARRAEQEATRRAEDEARATAEAERRRTAEAEAQAQMEAEAEARAAAEQRALAAAEAARAAQEEVKLADEASRQEAEAEAARQAAEARRAEEAAAAARQAEEEARRRQEEEARAAEEAEARARADEAARRQAEDNARAAQEAELRAREAADAKARAEEDARLRAEDEARARLAAEARARDEEDARRRAAALLARPKTVAMPVDMTPAADPYVTPRADAAMSPTDASVAQKPVAQQPSAQQPSIVKGPPRPDPRVTAQPDVINPGDLVCSQCSVGNAPTRKFCRKCGNSLAAAVPAKKVPWWKKLFGGGGSKRRVSKEAADKEKRRRQRTDASFKTQMAIANVKKVVLFLVMAGVIGGAVAFPSPRAEVMRRARGGVGGIQDLFNPKVKSVIPLEPTATSAIAGREAKFASDLGINSFWAEGAEGDGVGQTITFTFAEPTDLTKVLITSGSTDTLENYLANPRPKELHLVFDNGGSADIELSEGEYRKAQGFNLKGANGVSKVDIVISSIYPGRGALDTAIAEVEFKKKG